MRLFLSTDESPASMHLIASEDTWTLARNWVADYAGTPTPACRSDQYGGTQWPDGNTINLEAGKRYYLLLIHHFPSWAGGAWLGARYKKDTDPDPANGSVPTLRDLLEYSTNRPPEFYRGYDVYEPKRVGFVWNVPLEKARKFFHYDTRLPGNGNYGHEGREYGTDLAPEEKDAVVEYLKTF